MGESEQTPQRTLSVFREEFSVISAAIGVAQLSYKPHLKFIWVS